MTEPRTERIEAPFLPATASAEGLAAFPLGSMQSRAAARSLLDARRATEGEGTLLIIDDIGMPCDPNKKCTCPRPPAGTLAICKCFL